MGSLFVLAWLLGEGIVTWRSAKSQHMPPSPRQLALSSLLFLGLGTVAEYQPARAAAAAFAWGLDLAILLKVLPGGGQSAFGGGGWGSIGMAGNTVIIPDGTAASAVDASASTSTSSSGAGTSTGGAGTSTGGAGAGGSAAQNQAVAKQVLGANSSFRSWTTGQQWQCLVNLWNRESGWSASATNPSSGAYGIAQSLHGSKGGQGGNEYSSSDSEGLSASQLAGANAGDAADQILWGANYIASVYGSPCAAWQHEQSAGWY